MCYIQHIPREFIKQLLDEAEHMISRIIQTEVNVICRSEAEADNIDRGLNNSCCYIASVNTKRDWLICSHVALDKCNVSRPGNK